MISLLIRNSNRKSGMSHSHSNFGNSKIYQNHFPLAIEYVLWLDIKMSKTHTVQLAQSQEALLEHVVSKLQILKPVLTSLIFLSKEIFQGAVCNLIENEPKVCVNLGFLSWILQFFNCDTNNSDQSIQFPNFIFSLHSQIAVNG